MIQSESLKKNRILVSLAESNKNNLSWQFFSFVSFKFLMTWVHTAAYFLSLPSTGPPSRCSPHHCLETRGSSENHLISQSSKMCLTSHQGTWLHFPLLFFSQFLGFSLGLQALHTVGFSLLSLLPGLTILPLSPPHPNTHTLSRVVHSRSECDHVTPLNAIVIGRPSLTAGQQREGMLPAWMLLGQGESRLPQAPRGGREPLFAVPVWSLVTLRGVGRNSSRSERFSDTPWLGGGRMHWSCSWGWTSGSPRSLCSHCRWYGSAVAYSVPLPPPREKECPFTVEGGWTPRLPI